MGPRFAGPIAILRNWTYCLFYVMAELWGSVVVSVLFWGFANQICEVDEAKTFYPLFGLGANVALIFSGQVRVWVCGRVGFWCGCWGGKAQDARVVCMGLGRLLVGVLLRFGGSPQRPHLFAGTLLTPSIHTHKTNRRCATSRTCARGCRRALTAGATRCAA